MQVESNYPKFTERVPPLDLSQVNTSNSNCRTESELHRTQSHHHHHHHHRHDQQHTHPHHNLWSTKSESINSPTMKTGLHHPYHRSTYSTSYLSGNSNSSSGQTTLQQLGSDELPLDPRDWTRADVWKWLIKMALSEGLELTPEIKQKFPMNGKALCLMSLDMYLSRVPVGGKMLYRDFRVRLARAMALLS